MSDRYRMIPPRTTFTPGAASQLAYRIEGLDGETLDLSREADVRALVATLNVLNRRSNIAGKLRAAARARLGAGMVEQLEPLRDFCIEWDRGHE